MSETGPVTGSFRVHVAYSCHDTSPGSQSSAVPVRPFPCHRPLSPRPIPKVEPQARPEGQCREQGEDAEGKGEASL